MAVDVRNLVQDDGNDSERPRHFACDYPPLSLPAVQGSDRADEVRKLRQDRARLGDLTIGSRNFAIPFRRPPDGRRAAPEPSAGCAGNPGAAQESADFRPDRPTAKSESARLVHPTRSSR